MEIRELNESIGEIKKQIGDLERKEEYEMYKDIPSLISYNK